MARYTVVYEGDPTDVKILSGENAPGMAVTVKAGDLQQEVENCRASLHEADRLLAAAPEMLQALQLCIGSLPSDTDDLTREVFRRIRAAVANAEGR